MTKKNLQLKAALILKFGSQNEFCFWAQMAPTKLSEIIVGHREPKAEELRKFRTGLGDELFAAAFPSHADRRGEVGRK